ncbi:hypothetical protein CLM76_16250 [Vreelandella venusta]|nr:hypothetical protein CLM76_16250 [Halomonas hydrothermalis]
MLQRGFKEVRGVTAVRGSTAFMAVRFLVRVGVQVDTLYQSIRPKHFNGCQLIYHRHKKAGPVGRQKEVYTCM